MLGEMNRRDFLKVSAVTGASILASDLLYTDPLVYGAVNIPAAEKITVTSIIDNYSESTRPNYKIANRTSGNLYAEHGLACHIETVVDGRSHSLLFDFGRTFQGYNSNINTLKLDFDKVEALALSHGHNDHWGGFVEVLKSRGKRLSERIPLYLGEEAFAVRGQGQRVAHRPPKREDIESLGLVKIVEIENPTPIAAGAYLTGRIEKVTDYEKVDPGRWLEIGDKREPETFIGEQSVVLNMNGKGLVVITGCGHVGIVNTVKHAQKITGIKKVHAVMGGFHLTGAKDEVIKQTVADIKAMAPDYVVPMHCTGFEATGLFAKEMPDQFILNTVGTRYIFSLQTV
jgi:7,8-dihydropterin-6-yl-methyl-4-(beta-D-ribofuranosyl)aminobenzene 5'-phosphate synthase